MQTPFVTLMYLAALCSAALSGPVAAADIKTDHPGGFALSQNNGKATYTTFPDLLPLYTYDGDERGKSNCDKACTGVWQVVRVFASDKPTGDWTVIKRDDGRQQWAYKGKPVYTFYDDRAYDPPKGENLPFGWWQTEGAEGAPASDAYIKYQSKTPPKGAIWRVLEP